MWGSVRTQLALGVALSCTQGLCACSWPLVLHHPAASLPQPAPQVCTGSQMHEHRGDGTTWHSTGPGAPHAQVAYPAEVEQGEVQLMLYSDNMYVLSPYPVSQQTTEVGMGRAAQQSTGHTALLCGREGIRGGGARSRR